MAAPITRGLGWNADEIAILQDYVIPPPSQEGYYKEIMARLEKLRDAERFPHHRTDKAVRVKLRQLRLEQRITVEQPPLYTDEEKAIIVHFAWGKKIDYEMIQKLVPNRSIESLKRYIREYRAKIIADRLIPVKPSAQSIERKCLGCREVFISPDRKRIFMCEKCKR